MNLDIPLDRWIEPASLFREFARRPFPFWLDSSLRVGRFGRYSFMGDSPFLILRCRDGRTETIRGGKVERSDRDPLDLMYEILETHRTKSPRTDLPFCGGGIGFLGYDLGRRFEQLPARPPDDLGLPDLQVAYYDAVLVFDHAAGALHVCGIREDAVRHLHHRVEATAEPPRVPAGSTRDDRAGRHDGRLVSSFTRTGYLEAVRKAKSYIAAGDIFQVNLSQRFETPAPAGIPEIYLSLRAHSPAPFSAYLDLGEAQILSSSPERFLRLDGASRSVETRPIKGTRPRGRTPEDDRRLAEELIRSDKDRAELLMIVDLERNDLGRVCRFGSVRVPELATLEAYANVFHLVGTVSGELEPGRNISDLIRATFPGGSITGAPKVRAMEIIDELEPVCRGPYTGSLGYFSFSGDADLNILIRTLVAKGDRVCFHAGGGIVADSDPEAEYEETLHKARGMMRALGVSI